MLNHYKLFIEKAELPQEAADYLLSSIDSVLPKFGKELGVIVDTLYSTNFSIKATEEGRKNLSEISGVNIYTINFIFVICASKRMLVDFLQAGYSEELFWDTIMDAKYKLFECKEVKGVWGNFVEFWYNIFYALDIFKLGRLEFERTKYPDDQKPYTFGDITVNTGDTVYSIHIPSCGPLTKELRMDSYRRAFEFFAKERGDKPLICICHSWLLFEGNREIFPARLNMVDFMNDWDIIHSEEADEYGDCWRLFGKEYDGNADNLPQNTTQQKAMVAWLKEGKKTGEGFGVLIFDGEKIINI